MTIQADKQWALKAYLQACLPKCCLKFSFIRQSKRDKILERAHIRLDHELNVVYLIQSIRLFNEALSKLFSQDKIDQMKTVIAKVNLDSDQDADEIIEEEEVESSRTKVKAAQEYREQNPWEFVEVEDSNLDKTVAIDQINPDQEKDVSDIQV